MSSSENITDAYDSPINVCSTSHHSSHFTVTGHLLTVYQPVPLAKHEVSFDWASSLESWVLHVHNKWSVIDPEVSGNSQSFWYRSHFRQKDIMNKKNSKYCMVEHFSLVLLCWVRDEDEQLWLRWSTIQLGLIVELFLYLKYMLRKKIQNCILFHFWKFLLESLYLPHKCFLCHHLKWMRGQYK